MPVNAPERPSRSPVPAQRSSPKPVKPVKRARPAKAQGSSPAPAQLTAPILRPPPPPSQNPGKPAGTKAPADPRPHEPQKKAVAPRGALSDPKIAKDDRKTSSYAATPGKPVVGGISPHDPDQGGLGDCWFVASMSAVAQTQPELLKKNIRSNEDGSFSVKLFPNGQQKWVQVDSDLPQEDGSLSYASSTNKEELWPALYEKAAAQLEGGYDKLDGGYSYNGMTLLTGKRSDRKKNSRLSDDQLWSRLRHAESNNKPMTASTKRGEKKQDKHGLVAGHAYTVMGTERDGADRFVRLRNPWSHGEFKAPNTTSDIDFDKDGKLDGDDGVFRLKLSDFREHFKSTDMNNPPQESLALKGAKLILTTSRLMGPLVPNFLGR